MPRLTTVLACALCLLAAPSIALPASPDTDALAQRDWIEVATDHFHVLTDATEGAASSVGRRLEEFCGMLHALHPDLRTYPALPVDIYVFRDAADMAAFTPSQAEKLEGVALQGPGRGAFVMNTGVEGTERAAVVCHEYTHLFLNANFAELPVWLNEGLAEYYETFRLRGRRAEFGHRHDWMQVWLNSHEYQDLDLLFAINTQAAAYNKDNEIRTTAYAEGWAIAHYLQAKPDRAAKFDSVLALLRVGEPTRIAFRTQFPIEDWPRLVQDVKRYVHDGMFDSRSIELPAGIATPTAVGRPVAAAEALARLGDLMLALGEERQVDAATLFAAALDRDSTLAEAHAGAGYVADELGDSARAERCYARAEALATDDARVALLSGLGALERVNHLSNAGRAGSLHVHAALVLARSRFARCLRADPQNAEALGGFGLSYVDEGRMPDNAYHSLALALDAMPARKDIVQAMTRAHELREKSAAAAVPVAPTPAVPSPAAAPAGGADATAGDAPVSSRSLTPDDASRRRPARVNARSQAERLVQHANKLMRAGDLEGARADLVRARALPVGDDMHKYLDGLLVQLDRALGKP